MLVSYNIYVWIIFKHSFAHIGVLLKNFVFLFFFVIFGKTENYKVTEMTDIDISNLEAAARVFMVNIAFPYIHVHTTYRKFGRNSAEKLYIV